ncbi:MAG: hypothetical protein WDZ48_03390 [Pirellulales bacterium]
MQQATSRRWFYLGLLFVGHFVSNVAYLVVSLALVDVFKRNQSDSSGLIFPLLLVFYWINTSQPVLLAMWAIFGRQRLVHRAVLTVSVLAVLTLGPIGVLWPSWHEPNATAREMMRQYGAFQAAYFALASAAFLLVRSVVRWEIVPGEAASGELSPWHPTPLTLDVTGSTDLGVTGVSPVRGMHGQDARGTLNSRVNGVEWHPAILSVRDFLGLIALTAVALAAMRVYEGQYLTAILRTLLGDVWHGVVALGLLPLCLATNRRHVFAWLALGLGLAVVVHSADVAIKMVGMVAVAARGDVARIVSTFGHSWGGWLWVFGGFLATVALSLWLLRLAGFRLANATTEASPGEAGG